MRGRSGSGSDDSDEFEAETASAGVKVVLPNLEPVNHVQLNMESNRLVEQEKKRLLKEYYKAGEDSPNDYHLEVYKGARRECVMQDNKLIREYSAVLADEVEVHIKEGEVSDNQGVEPSALACGVSFKNARQNPSP